MVVFTCNHCGDSLQKPKVEKHYQTTCKSFKNLTCVDCLNDFRGEDYQGHFKCLNESERYAAKGSMAIGAAKKGELKQESWMEIVNGIISNESNLPMHVEQILLNLKGFNNVPRKKAKFMNFNRNNLGRYFNEKHVEEVWNLMEKYKQEQFSKKHEQSTIKQQTSDKNEVENEEITANGASAQCVSNSHKRKKASEETETEKATKKKKIKIVSENMQIAANIESANNGKNKFSFEEEILKVLKVKKQISTKKLQKKVLNAYVKHRGMDTFTEKHVKKYNKQLTKVSNIQLKDDLVLLA